MKCEAKQLDGTRPLGAWELYRALNDAIDEGHDQFDLSNRDAFRSNFERWAETRGDHPIGIR